MSSTSGDYIPHHEFWGGTPDREEEWCAADNAPAAVCGGPHVRYIDSDIEITAPSRGFWMPGGGFWQFIMPTLPDYADWRDRLNNGSDEERIDAALSYMRHIMGNPEHKDQHEA